MWYKCFVVFICLLYTPNCEALFEDQVGKFDWRVQHIGCPNEVILDKSRHNREQLFVSTSSNIIALIDVNSGEIVWRQLNEEHKQNLSPKIQLSKNDVFSIVSNEYLRVFDRETGVLKMQHHLNDRGFEEHEMVVKNKIKFVKEPKNSVAFDESVKPEWLTNLSPEIKQRSIVAGAKRVYAVYTEATKQLQILDQNTKKELVKIEIASGNFAPIKKIALLEADNGQLFKIVVVREDCQLDFYKVRQSEKTAALEWSRFEALAGISSIEMIDLPLSDSQATIETEFGVSDVTILKSFLLRVTGQFEQLRRSFIALGNQFARALQLLTSGNESLLNVLRVLWGDNARLNKRPRPGASIAESKFEPPMERDFFNLHKLIVVSTQSGSLYGIDNQYGTVVWSLYLGTQFEPMKTQINTTKIPLFIQRTTANFQFDSQAAVVFNLKETKKTRVVLFNPVNGKVVNSHTFDSLKRVELAPFANKEQLAPLIIVDMADKVQFLPAVESDFQLTQSLHLLSIDPKNGMLKGDLIELHGNKLTTAWTVKLNLEPDEKIVLVAERNRNERVHSQGKVLGDRSVLYKYSNPNLVAIMSVDAVNAMLTINLVDAVSGSIVYTAKHDRATEPVNLLHCENWIVYSYWNEKSRRTELGVIELYEGLEQTNVKHFNSFTPLRHPLNVITNSFVFPQGVSAIAASETEQGLTTRSIVIAMPFGGLLEVSKRFLDARRPLEMTPELREEMIVPYMPEIPIATEDLINYNQTVLQIENIKTAASGLESTSLMLAYGLDLFYTRLTPSGTFDVLKDDFDYVLISVVLLGLVIASFVLKRISRYQNLKQAWA